MIMDNLYNKISIIFVLIYIFILYTFDFSDKMIYLLILTIGLILYLSLCGTNKIIENMENDITKEGEIISKNRKIDELTERIKTLEEAVKSNEWSVYRTHEIQKLRNIKDNIEESTTISTTNSTTTTNIEPILTEEKVEPLSKPNRIEPMGMFDSICFDKMVKDKKYNLINEKQLDTYLGSTLPLESSKTEGGLYGPSIDGQEKSPKKMSMFGNNQSSISCCDNSPFFTSTGCICITGEQEKYIGSRGGNHILPEKSQCPV